MYPLGPATGRARPGGRARLPRRDARRARAAPADEAAPALPAVSRGRRAARVGRQDDPRGRVLRAARAPERRRRPAGGRRGRASWTSPRSRASTTRCSRGSTPRAPRSPRSSRATSSAAAARGVRPAGGRELHRGRHVPHAEHAARVQGRALRRRLQGRAHDDHAAGGSPAGSIEMPEDAATPRRVTEAEPFTPDGKLTFGKLDAVFKSGNATRDTIPSHLLVGPDVSAEVAELLLPRVPRGRLRARGRRAPGQRAELRRLQGDRRARTALDAARGGQRAQVPRDVAVVLPHLAVPRRGGCRESRHCALPADCAAASSFPTLICPSPSSRPSAIPSLRGALWDRTR